MLWSHSLVFGDQSADPAASPQWRAYGRWRRMAGARFGIYDEPGQVFEPGERAEMAEAVAWTMRCWIDAVIVPAPTSCVIHLSHDEFVMLDARARRLAFAALEGLGLKPMK